MSIAPRELPSFDQIRSKVNQLALQDGHWAGAPMPVHELPLVIEPRYPYAKLNGFCFGAINKPAPEPDPEIDQVQVINQWFSHKRQATVYVCDYGPGTPRFAVVIPAFEASRLDLWINTLGASQAWDLDAEVTALDKLRSLVPGHAFEHYFLTGTFLETSKKSNVTYLFRKLRPTVAMTRDKHGRVSYLTSLCLHPIGHYQNSWAGCMCPTDDVVAHLLLMRADEYYFWRKANHHAFWQPGAGI